MPRYKLTLEYDGTGLLGWQRQQEGETVQSILERALEGFCGEAVEAYASGRTDAGVHARGQVVHVDLPQAYDPHTIRMALNDHMGYGQVAVLEAEEVSEDFHARFSAKQRHYTYVIVNRYAPLTIDAGRMWRVPEKLDVALMEEGAFYLLGKHDFTSFRSTECQSQSPVKTLDDIVITRDEDWITIDVSAQSFLHHQVRNIVGSLRFVGSGKWKPTKIKEVLAAKDRRKAGQTAPPEGLYFAKVEY